MTSKIPLSDLNPADSKAIPFGQLPAFAPGIVPSFFLVILPVLAPFFVYLATMQSIVAIWNSSETFAHGYIILPICLWMIWMRRGQLLQMRPTPCWPALLLLAACGFGWLLGELADVKVVRQYMFVAMVPFTTLAVLGWRMTWAMAFPLFFMMLTVPFGEVFIPPLINFTADFTVAALQLTGIPVLREGTRFSLPSGNWSVVEACSGVRYLISSFTLGCLFAYLTYRSTLRKLLFIVFAIIVPIIANGLRAYMIVMIGHLSGMTLAVGVDHLIYGWVFFGLVMFLMFWVGSFWREAPNSETDVTPLAQTSIAQPSASIGKRSIVAIVSIGLIAVWPGYSSYINHENNTAPEIQLTSLQTDWQESTPFTIWKPNFNPAFTEFSRSYIQNNQQIGMQINYYRNQARASGLISSTNTLVDSEDQFFHQSSSQLITETLSGKTLKIEESIIKENSKHILVWQFYWIADEFLSNPYLGKLLQAKEKILLYGDDGAALFLFTPINESPEQARTNLQTFLNSNLEKIETALRQSKHSYTK